MVPPDRVFLLYRGEVPPEQREVPRIRRPGDSHCTVAVYIDSLPRESGDRVPRDPCTDGAEILYRVNRRVNRASWPRPADKSVVNSPSCFPIGSHWILFVCASEESFRTMYIYIYIYVNIIYIYIYTHYVYIYIYIVNIHTNIICCPRYFEGTRETIVPLANYYGQFS